MKGHPLCEHLGCFLRRNKNSKPTITGSLRETRPPYIWIWIMDELGNYKKLNHHIGFYNFRIHWAQNLRFKP